MDKNSSKLYLKCVCPSIKSVNEERWVGVTAIAHSSCKALAFQITFFDFVGFGSVANQDHAWGT